MSPSAHISVPAAGLTFATEASATRTFDRTGEYSARLTVSDGALTNSTEVTFTVTKEQEPDDGPGFGAGGAALVAVAATVALAAASRRRRA